MKQLFLDIYSKVFNEDGSMKNCGRTVCIQLITLAEQLDETMQFGDKKTGFINIENMCILYNKIKAEV